MTGGFPSISAWVGVSDRLRPRKSKTARLPFRNFYTMAGSASQASGAGELGITKRQAVQRRDFVGVEHRAAWGTGRVAHVTVPVLAGAADADRFSVIVDVGQDDNFRAARHTPAFAKDVELDLAEAAGKRDLLLGSNPLIAEKDDTVLVIRVLYFSEHIGVQTLRKVGTADFRAHGGAGWNDL
jgi:hypothetical protein